MQVLSIGNSFSSDAQRYIYEIAKSRGEKVTTFNLFVPGCPLSTHYRNMLSKDRAYALEMNGRSTGFKVSMEEALLSRSWDVVTIQQVSSESTNFNNYTPYLEKLVEYVRLCVPKAKLYLHQTWAYEQDSQKLNGQMGYANYQDMLADIVHCNARALELVKADGLIPSGQVFAKMLENGIEKVHRDTYHAGWGLGRFALGLTWYKVLTGNSVLDVTFRDLDAEATQEELEIAKKCVMEVTQQYGY